MRGKKEKGGVKGIGEEEGRGKTRGGGKKGEKVTGKKRREMWGGK